MNKKKLDIFIESINLLDKNHKITDNSYYTIPSNNLYPHQWSWDSGWIIYGYCALNKIDRAEKEMLSLFKYQWKNGLIPSIIFHDLQYNTYWPSPDVWDLKNKAKHLTENINCTGIVQPPLHADACLAIFKKGIDKVEGKIFLKKIYDKLLLWHKYLYQERDIYDEGIVFIRHPWESGMDNSPIWDVPLNRINITEYKYSSCRTDNKKVNSEERPTDLTYEKYIQLIDLFKQCNYNEKEIAKNSEFVVQDVLFNVLLQKSNYALLEISKILEKKDDFKLINSWINKTKNGIENKFYHQGFYYDVDLKTKKPILTKTITGLSAIYFSNKTEEIVNILKKEFLVLDENNYCISSLSRKDQRFDSINYWRGPMWTNLTWMIINGLEKNNQLDLANKIKSNCINNIETLGFYEYFDSVDNFGCGDNHFSWTASVYICLFLNFKF